MTAPLIPRCRDCRHCRRFKSDDPQTRQSHDRFCRKFGQSTRARQVCVECESFEFDLAELDAEQLPAA